jgi:anti-anti-sigma factor
LAEAAPTLPTLPTLQVELDALGSACRLTLRGELCGTSLAALEAQVDQLGCLPCEQVIVDMRHVTQIDDVGGKVILGLYYYVLGRGGELRVSAVAGAVAETLRAVSGALLPHEDGLAG